MANQLLHRRVHIHISSIFVERREGIARKTVRKQTKEYVDQFVTASLVSRTHTQFRGSRVPFYWLRIVSMPHRWRQRDDLRRTMVRSIRRPLFCAVVRGDDDVKLPQLPKKRHLILF